MTTKLTGREALAYMATGGWFMIQRDSDVYRMLHNYELVFWCGISENEISSAFDVIDALTDGITPCPDPTVKVGEYENHRLRILGAPAYQTIGEERKAMVCFFEKWFQRKEVKS